jgi:four helix bundle protein
MQKEPVANVNGVLGTACASVNVMIARKFEDLEAWQLANALKLEVYRLIKSEPAASDRDYCRQIRRSAASSSRSIAEGFGRFRPRPFAQFMEFSIASTNETHDALLDGVHQGYFAPPMIAPALKLVERCLKVSTRLLLYLKRCKEDDLPFL